MCIIEAETKSEKSRESNKSTVQTYARYKDSGVEWLGEIPEHWEVERLKYIFKEIQTGSTPSTSNQKFYGGNIDWYTPKDLDNDKLISAEKKLNQLAIKKREVKFFSEDSILIVGIGATAGKTSYLINKGTFNQQITGFHSHTGNNKYFFYLFFSLSNVMLNTANYTTLAILNNEFFKVFSLVKPPLPEQTAIANFLDDKTQKIDQAIGIKEQQIALLKERKQILIHKAVTGQLIMENGKWIMTPKEKMKDSGVEWIGEIPEHWEVKRMRNVFNFGKGLTITKENLREDGVFCVNYGEIHSRYGFELDTIIHPLKCVDEDYLKTDPKAIIKEGDFVFADTSEDIDGSGNFTYLKSSEPIFAGYHTVIARSKFKIASRFFAYVFESMAFRNQIRTQVKGVKVYSITQFILKNPTVWFPLIEEQNQIVNYLDQQTNKIDTAISIKQQEIEKLKEYKSSLINSVVTGKVKIIKN